MPVSSVGMDDMITILFDFPVGRLINYLFGDPRLELTVPICVPTSYQRQYFYLCDPIETQNLDFNEQSVWGLRTETHKSLTDSINFLLKIRDVDSSRYPLRRILGI